MFFIAYAVSNGVKQGHLATSREFRIGRYFRGSVCIPGAMATVVDVVWAVVSSIVCEIRKAFLRAAAILISTEHFRRNRPPLESEAIAPRHANY